MNSKANDKTQADDKQLMHQLRELVAERSRLEERIGNLHELLGDEDDAEPADENATPQVELAEMEARYKRALADFQNYRRRAGENETEARRQGVIQVIESLISVLDNFRLALDIDPKAASAASVIEGVSSIRAEMLRTLAAQGLREVIAQPGDELDPNRHQAIMQQQDASVPPGSVVRTISAGYVLDDRVIRPARVIVRPAAAGAAAPGSEAEG